MAYNNSVYKKIYDEYSQKYYYFGKDLFALNEGNYHLQLKNLNGLCDPYGNPLTAGYYQVYSDHSVNPYSFSLKNGFRPLCVLT